MMRSYAPMAEDADFMHLFKLVVDLGATQQPFLLDVLNFTARFVNPKLRRLRVAAFAASSRLPMAVPRLKIAVLKWAYRQPPTVRVLPRARHRQAANAE